LSRSLNQLGWLSGKRLVVESSGWWFESGLSFNFDCDSQVNGQRDFLQFRTDKIGSAYIFPLPSGFPSYESIG
jgi:hypothetical protein